MVEHAMHEAHEHAGIEAHGTGDVEQDHQPQRLVLSAAPHEIDWHPAVADVATDGAAHIEASALALHAPAPGESGAHFFGKPRRQGVGFGDGLRVGDFAEVRLRQLFRARGAFHAPARPLWLRQGTGIVAGCRLAHVRGVPARGVRPWECPRGRRRRGTRVRGHFHDAPHAVPQPMRIKQGIEFVPVRTVGTEERLEASPQRQGTSPQAARQDAGGIFALLQANGEGIAPQHERELGELV
jgi:hypothetical protein